MTRNLLGTLIALALCAGVGSARAQSADLSTWTRAGDVAAVTATGATLTTASTDSSEVPLSAAPGALIYFDLEPAIGASTTLGADTYEGSALTQSFVAAAGNTVSFNWSLSTVGFVSGLYLDRAFALIDGSTLVNLGTIAASATAGSFSHTFTTAGAHSLAFGVVDVDDVVGVSTLAVSNFAVSAVPEPGTVALMLLGLGLVGRGALRARRSRDALVG